MENLKQQNELLLAARKEIEVAAEHRNFLTIVSHELRTPLYAVTALSGILLDGFFANAENEDDAEFAEAQELVTIIKQSGDLLLQIVSNILDFSKYESSSLALEKRPFAIREAMDLAIEIVSTAASKDGPQINAYLFEEPETRVAAGDVTRFRQILVNLLNNAIKFTPLEGDVVLILRTSVPADDPTRILVEGAVRDTGVGVSHEHKEKLFKQFAQLDESITRRFGGTGLGLNIVKKLTTLMGGDVWLSDGAGMHEEDLEVLSRLENRGATFCFRVFLDRLSPGKAKLADSVQEPLELSRSPSSISFAIVDNRPLNRDALRYLLQALGVDSAAIIECSSLGDFLLTDKSVSALVMDFRTCMHEVSALKCILRSGLSKRCLLLCGPGSHKTFRKSLRLTKAHEVTVLLRPAKMSAVVRFINELPNDTLSVADVRDVLRAKPVFFEATDAGGGTAQVEAVKSPATPLRTSTTDTSGLTRVADVSLEEIGDSSDSSLPTILTTPSGIGTPQAGLEALSSPRASAVEPRDYFSLAHNLSATTVLESPAPGPDRQTPSPSKPAKRPAAAAEIFVDTKLGPVKLPVFRVLVVEDNLINQRVTGKLLQRLHQKYDFANDGFQAIERVQSAADDGRQYEVIFMDLQMPEMDGFEATRRIRELAGDAIYICALSGNAFAGDRVRAQESGMNDFVPKPARQQDLLAALGRLVQQGR
ncbi:hypothetical protein DFJ74DRAFT_496422 [Hyaloraphidium curvatum]|nr:hypothetical protein DFJ74DRAFT_496422 [Hyaloraphidium curvatum]